MIHSSVVCVMLDGVIVSLIGAELLVGVVQIQLASFRYSWRRSGTVAVVQIQLASFRYSWRPSDTVGVL